MSRNSRDFRDRFFSGVSDSDWNDWRWQLKNRIRNLEGLKKIFRLSDDERQAVLAHKGSLPLAMSPYYASLLDRENAEDPIRKTVIPVMAEYETSYGETEDPLGEEPHRPVPGIVHRYPDRVLFLATGFCSTYCRYCTRSRLVGDAGEYAGAPAEWKTAIEYIASKPEVRDVLVTGGDPLTMTTDRLEWILKSLRAIPHVEFIRIGTKVPAVLPQRITGELTEMIKKYHPVFMSLHFMHPDELTPETSLACERLADAGIPLGSQTVLLRGVNDRVETLKDLMQGLLRVRVKPYYLFHCDPISGSAHLRTSVEKGLEMIRGLRGHTTGYAVPHYAIDIAGEGGKVALVPDHIVGRDGNDLVVRNYGGRTFRYPDPSGSMGTDPSCP